MLIKESSLGAMAIVGGRGAITAIVLAIYLRRPRWTWSVAQIGGALAYVVAVSTFVTATQTHLGGQRDPATVHRPAVGGAFWRVVSA